MFDSVDSPGYNFPYGKETHVQKLFGYDLEVTQYHGEVADHEKDIWEKYYLPADPTGKVVLSLGAGCGEDAAFYLSHGAKQVIAVECDPLAFSCLAKNVVRLDLSIVPIHSMFDLGHLSIKHDMMKMDCEQGEVELYNYQGSLAPCIIETHTHEITMNLMRKFRNLKPVFEMGGGLWFLHLNDSSLPDITPENWKPHLL